MIPGDSEYNQKHYEALGEVITEEVYKLLVDRGNLEKVYLDWAKESFVFASQNFANASKLLCLIHGSGVVRAGQWARRLIINNDLEKGTQLPYIQTALRDCWSYILSLSHLVNKLNVVVVNLSTSQFYELQVS